MNFLKKLFKPRNEIEASQKGNEPYLSFILLSKPELPDAQSIITAYKDYSINGESLKLITDDSNEEAKKDILQFTLDDEENIFILLVPAPIPNNEAEHYANFSISALNDKWKVPPYSSHLMVTLISKNDSSKTHSLLKFTSLLASISKASSSVGIYWNKSGATHNPTFFEEIALEKELIANIMLWCGVSIARTNDGRLSLLSMGMEHFNLSNLMLEAGRESEGIAIETMYDLLVYLIKFGRAIPAGDTIGRTEDERLVVSYTTSPIDETKEVWCVELP